MDILVLGGTQWVGRAVSREALERGHLVTCLARGVSGQVADGAELVTADRIRPDAYDAVKARRWDAVVEVSSQPGFVKAALAAISAGHWTYVSSGNVYLRHDEPGADESAELQPTTYLETVTPEQYGPAKRACEDASRERYGDRLLVARAGLIGGPGDHTGRSGAWVARCARDRHGAVLIPSEPDMATQIVDVRDLAAFLVDGFEKHIVGTFNAVGPMVPFSEWFALARAAAQHDGQVVTAPSAWPGIVSAVGGRPSVQRLVTALRGESNGRRDAPPAAGPDGRGPTRIRTNDEPDGPERGLDTRARSRPAPPTP